MTHTVHLWLTINDNDIEGESRVPGRAGTIECSFFNCEVTRPWDDAAGQLTGAKKFTPVKILKRVDKTTPLLLKALCLNEPVNSATFMFYRVGRSGFEEQFAFMVVLEDAHISSVRQATIIAGQEAPPMMEEVEFVFQRITWTYEGGVTFQDSVERGSQG